MGTMPDPIEDEMVGRDFLWNGSGRTFDSGLVVVMDPRAISRKRVMGDRRQGDDPEAEDRNEPPQTGSGFEFRRVGTPVEYGSPRPRLALHCTGPRRRHRASLDRPQALSTSLTPYSPLESSQSPNRLRRDAAAPEPNAVHETNQENWNLPTSPLQTPTELCTRLEGRGIETWSQGEGLLSDLQHPESGLADSPRFDSFGVAATRTLLCRGDARELLGVMPRAVVTASHTRRLTMASTAGPIDIFPLGGHRLEDVLTGFALSPLAFAYRWTAKQWCDPSGARRKFESGILDSADPDTNPFTIAPRRYWIAARLASQFQLTPAPSLLESARLGLPEVLSRLPTAAPARREISRILFSPDPSRGLGFLYDSGLSPALFPGMKRAGETRVSQLGDRPALRWAAWLDGTAIQRAIVKLRVPHTLARHIERIHRAHPIDRTIESLREGGTRKILQRLDHEDIHGLITWRRLDLENAVQNETNTSRRKRLEEVEAHFAKIRLQREQTRQVRSLALDGRAVMDALGDGPGPQVGRALAHLAKFVARHPEANESEALAVELRDWAKKKDEPGETERS